MLRIKLVKSVIGQTPRNVKTVRALGLGKTNSVVMHEDNPSIRGQIHHAKHMLEVTVVEDAPATSEEAPKASKAPKKAAKATEESN